MLNNSMTCLGIYFPYHYTSKGLKEKGVKINLKKKKKNHEKYFFLNHHSVNEALSGPFIKLSSILYAYPGNWTAQTFSFSFFFFFK